MGAVDMLRSAFAAAKSSAAAGPDVAVLRSALQGNRKVAIAADTLAEIQQALDLARDFGFEPALIGARDADKAFDRIVAQRAAVVIGGLAPAVPPFDSPASDPTENYSTFFEKENSIQIKGDATLSTIY